MRILLALFILISSISPVLAAGQDVVSPVARGVEYNHLLRKSSAGPVSIHVLKVDLSDSTVGLDVLYNEKEITTPKTLSSLANKDGIVAAINGDFFYREAGCTVPVGPMITNNRLFYNPGTNPGMGVFGITTGGETHIGPWKGQGNIILPGGEAFRLAGLNKPGSGYSWPILYTSDWGARSPDVGDGIVTLVGVDSMVLYVAEEGRQPIPPHGGFAVVVGGEAAESFKQLETMDPLEIDYKTIPEWEDFELALGGGAILLRDGRIVNEGHQVGGRHPRSAVGISADEKTLYMVTVDGRQNNSVGMDQLELAQLMKELGAAEALNLDGGGSSTMLARPLGYHQLTVHNMIAGGTERAIPNALGVFTYTKPGPAAGLVLKVENNMFLSLAEKAGIDIRAYDANYNPVDPPGQPRDWSVEPAGLGKVENGYFHPQDYGEGILTLTAGGLRESIPIKVVPNLPKEIELSVQIDRQNLTAVVEMQYLDGDGAKTRPPGEAYAGFRVSAPGMVLMERNNFDETGSAFFRLRADTADKYKIEINTELNVKTGFEIDFMESVKDVYGARSVVLPITEKIAFVDGMPQELDVPAFIENGRTYVPVRFIAESFAAFADWEPKDSRAEVIILDREDLAMRIGIGENYYLLQSNGEEKAYEFSGSARISNGRTFLPFRPVAEAFGAGVNYGVDDAGYVTWVSFEQ